MKITFDPQPLIPCPTCNSLPLYDRYVVGGERYVSVICVACGRKTACHNGPNAYRDAANEWNGHRFPLKANGGDNN